MAYRSNRREFIRDLGLSAAAFPFIMNLPSLGVDAHLIGAARRPRAPHHRARGLCEGVGGAPVARAPGSQLARRSDAGLNIAKPLYFR